MAVVSAFLVPGSPLPMLRPDIPAWGTIAGAYETAGEALAASRPDVILVYSTQWIAVLDQLWQMRKRCKGLHVDENWHEFGDLPFDFKIDTALTRKCLAVTQEAGVRSREVDYDAFPIDTGTIVAAHFLNPEGRIPMVVTSNNLYHDFDLTEKLGRLAAREGNKKKRRMAVVGVGGLSGSFFRQTIDPGKDKIARPADDKRNKDFLKTVASGKIDSVRKALPDYAAKSKADMGMKHLAWIFGALNGRYASATVHGYGPVYGAGAAVIQFNRR